MSNYKRTGDPNGPYIPEGHFTYRPYRRKTEIGESAMSDADGTYFQQRVAPWMQACFGHEISMDVTERNHRFLEEAIELVQSTGCTSSDAHQLVEYVFGRDVGEPEQEVGGVMVTLAALCLATGMDMDDCGETELARIWTKVEAIRAKQSAKPKNGPLPQAVEAPDPWQPIETAPDDGSSFLGGWQFVPGDWVFSTIAFDPDDGFICPVSLECFDPPEIWGPNPTPPAQESAGDE